MRKPEISVSTARFLDILSQPGTAVAWQLRKESLRKFKLELGDSNPWFWTEFWTSPANFPKFIDLCHSAAMLSLRRIKSFVFARLASHWIRVWARVAVKKQSFLLSWDSTWSRVTKVYWRYKAMNFPLHYSIEYCKTNNCFPSSLNFVSAHASFSIRTVPTNTEVFLCGLNDYAGKVELGMG